MIGMRTVLLSGAIAFLAIGLGPLCGSEDAEAFFESRIRPLLAGHCIRCHGPDKSEGELRLDSRAGWMAGGASGAVLVPGRPDQSLLVRAVSYRDPELQMPPADGIPLSESQVGDIIEWIRTGAFDPRHGDDDMSRAVVRQIAAEQHWAFQPFGGESSEPSQRRYMSHADGAAAHRLDTILNTTLHSARMRPAPRADSRTLVRRAVFDLHGLPPSPAQYALGATDFPRLVDQLLASPRYGERWARHWLDVARYADTKDGVLMYGDARIRPFAYTYRDYVIRSFNDDKPFDRFVVEQIAADQITSDPHSPDLAALGFLTLGRIFDRNRHDQIDDQIDTMARGFLGLTVACARCHDHKFDPIPTSDYYALYGVFANTTEPIERPRIEAVAHAGEPFEEELSAKLAAIRAMEETQYQMIRDVALERTGDYLVRVATTEPDLSETAIFFLSLVPEHLRPQIVYRWRQLVSARSVRGDPVFGPWHDLMAGQGVTPDLWRDQGVDRRVIDALVSADPNSPEEIARAYGALLVAVGRSGDVDDPLHDLAIGPGSPVHFPKSDVRSYMSRADKDKYGGMLGELDLLAVHQRHAAARAMAVVDTERRVEPVIFLRGDPSLHGPRVTRHFLTLLSGDSAEPFHQGSGRLELARAIVAPSNPLTPRVLANRIWLHHFGQGLVETPDDFGLRTPQPIQWRALDFLAREIVRHQWRLKPIHRLIMTSEAYQRMAMHDTLGELAEQQERDPENRYAWRGNRRRLDFEAMRDSMLFVSGLLDMRMYGRPEPIATSDNYRRTIYAIVERQSIPDMVRSFDVPAPDATVGKRNVTAVPQQALFALNSDFVARCATAIADQVLTPASDAGWQVTELYQRVLGRIPTEAERQAACDYVAAEGSRSTSTRSSDDERIHVYRLAGSVKRFCAHVTAYYGSSTRFSRSAHTPPDAARYGNGHWHAGAADIA